MIYEGIEQTEYRRPVKCPNCGNEEISDNANYCMICGEYIINDCTFSNCGMVGEMLPGNARYCPYCGAPSRYLRKGFLAKCEHDINNKEEYKKDPSLYGQNNPAPNDVILF